MKPSGRQLPTPTSLSPPRSSSKPTLRPSDSSSSTTLSNDSWQSRLSSPVSSLNKTIQQGLYELKSLPTSCERFDFMNNPRLHLLLELESLSFLERERWLRNNKSFDVDQQLFNETRQMLAPFAEEVDETSFVAVMLLRHAASRRRICNGSSRYLHTVAAAFLAGKICEENDPHLEELIKEAGLSKWTTPQQIIKAERRMACDLGWNFSFASPTEIGFSLLDCMEGLKPAVKAAIMQVAAPVCYNAVFSTGDRKPSLLMASILTAIFTFLFDDESQRFRWADLFSQLVQCKSRDVSQLSLEFVPAVVNQFKKVMSKNRENNKS